MPRPHDLPEPPHVLRPAKPGWPAQLDALDRPPQKLRVAGVLPPLERAVAVVGTRYADEESLGFTRQLAGELAAAGCPIVSGGAWGIDGAAHAGALDAGGSTVVVLPTGFDRVYPERHRSLFGQVLERGGALVTELDDGVPPARWTFLARNRLIAALGAATVVVQAPARSGALSTAAAAHRLEKLVFSVPYAPWEIRGEGCLALLAGDAQVCTSARDILSVRPLGPGHALPENPPDDEKRNALNELDDDGQVLFGILSRRARHPDELALSADLPISRVQRGLLQLQLAGLVTPRADGTYATNVKTGQR